MLSLKICRNFNHDKIYLTNTAIVSNLLPLFPENKETFGLIPAEIPLKPLLIV